MSNGGFCLHGKGKGGMAMELNALMLQSCVKRNVRSLGEKCQHLQHNYAMSLWLSIVNILHQVFNAVFDG